LIGVDLTDETQILELADNMDKLADKVLNNEPEGTEKESDDKVVNFVDRIASVSIEQALAGNVTDTQFAG
jgi:hypothetical protein